MNKVLVFCICISVFSAITAQDRKRQFDIQPYANGIYAGQESLVEGGPEFSWKQSIWGQSILLRPFLRIPVTNSTENSVYTDRYSPTWRTGLTFEYGILNNIECTQRNGHSFVLQAETGYSSFEYYPNGNTTPSKESLLSYAFEFKVIGFYSSKQLNSRQISPQFRIRYSRNATPSDEVGVVNGFLSTNMIIEEPYIVSLISPATSIIYYPGAGIYSYGGSIFYDYASSNGRLNEFKSGRLRIEANLFCSPQIRMNYFKFGISPFISIRTNGSDKFKSMLIGGQISVRFGTSFLQLL